MSHCPALARVIAFFEKIAPGDAARLGEIYADDAYFRDPFNEVSGIAAITRVYQHMFEQLDECRFVISESVAEGDSSFLIWDLTFRVRGLWRKLLSIHGSSHIRLNADGKITYHRDYWDAAGELYVKLPLIGPVLRLLRRKLA